MKPSVLSLSCLLVLSGCGTTATIVQRDAYGGILSLRGDIGEARKLATKKMRAHCRDGYHIVEQKRYVVGTETSNRSYDRHHEKDDKHPALSLLGSFSSHRSRSTTTDVYELQVRYRCRKRSRPMPALKKQ